MAEGKPSKCIPITLTVVVFIMLVVVAIGITTGAVTNSEDSDERVLI